MSSDAANDRAIIEWAASTPVAGHEAEWIRFVTEHLGLEAAYLPAVQEVLTQGRWRQADNSMGYVKTAAAREAARMGLADIENPFVTNR